MVSVRELKDISRELEDVGRVLKRIDFLKLDCEGGEYEILFGCSEETLKKIKKISIEYHNIDKKRNSEVLKAFLLIKGYKIEVDEVWGYIYAKK